MKCAIQEYGLPEPTFVLDSIAFSLSYSYFTCLDMKDDQQSIVVVPNCGYSFFSVTIYKLERNKITFLYSYITDGMSGRNITYLLAQMIQKNCIGMPELEEMESLPFLRLMSMVDKQKKLICSGGANIVLM